MKSQTLGDKPELKTSHAKVGEAITVGQPVCLHFNETDDGMRVVLPSTAGNALGHATVFGIALSTYDSADVGKIEEFAVGGLCRTVTILRSTRAASTVTYASVASVAAGQVLSVDTVNNVLQVVGTVAATGYVPWAVLGQSLASIASAATTTSDSSTARTSSAKVWLRIM